MGLRAKILILAELAAVTQAGAATTEAVGRLSAPSGTASTVVPETALELARFGDVAPLAAKLGVSQDDKGRVVQVRPGGKAPEPRALSPRAVNRLVHFLLRVNASRADDAFAAALKSYLKPRMPAADLNNNEFLTTTAGVTRLTDLGKSVLIDIFGAEDGQLLNDIPPPDPKLLSAPRRPIQPMSMELRDAVAFAADPAGAARAFDGRLPLAGFDWDALEREGTQSIALKKLGPSVLDGYAQNREKGTVRVMIEAPNRAATDRLGAAGADLTRSDRDPHLQRSLIYKETGLDRALMDGYDAKVIRAIDNIVVVDVPRERAAKLGKALLEQGVLSMPARIIHSSVKAAAAGPTPLLGGQFLPIPTSFDLPRGEEDSGVGLKNLQSRDLMKIDSLAAKGMWGQNTTAGIIDSGIDVTHPDFKGRIRHEDYVDFTGEGLEDRLGHGTHVAGSIGGSGEASRGMFKGVAPKVRFVVAKVFGDTGESSEDIILAAMKWMVRKRPDTVNLSLGGPGDPSRDPLSVMANRMMIEENIMMVVAAGNEGPRKGSIAAPGNARYVLTVTGVNKKGKFSFFPSRGPVHESDGGSFNKPDITAVAGDVLPQEPQAFWKRMLAPGDAFASPANPQCVFGPGVISTRSKHDLDEACVLAGNPYYRFLSGTSMGTPQGDGVNNAIIGYAKTRGRAPLTTEVKSLLMETASDLGVERETQGAGLIDGSRLAETVADRVSQGLPVGNIAYMLAVRMVTTADRELLKAQTRYRETSIGLLDSEEGRLVHTEREMKDVLAVLRRRSAKKR